MIIIIIGGEGSFLRENFESFLLASLTKDEGRLNMSSVLLGSASKKS